MAGEQILHIPFVGQELAWVTNTSSDVHEYRWIAFELRHFVEFEVIDVHRFADNAFHFESGSVLNDADGGETGIHFAAAGLGHLGFFAARVATAENAAPGFLAVGLLQIGICQPEYDFDADLPSPIRSR